jgi:hypothetical protein
MVGDGYGDDAYDGERMLAERERRRAEAEYELGVADARRYQQDKALFGERLADVFAAEEEFTRFWKHGEDGEDY